MTEKNMTKREQLLASVRAKGENILPIGKREDINRATMNLTRAEFNRRGQDEDSVVEIMQKDIHKGVRVTLLFDTRVRGDKIRAGSVVNVISKNELVTLVTQGGVAETVHDKVLSVWNDEVDVVVELPLENRNSNVNPTEHVPLSALKKTEAEAEATGKAAKTSKAA